LTSLDVLDKIKRKKKKQGNKSRARPAWAVVEPATDKVTTNSSDDLSFGDEDEDLLDFAADLDFEKDTQDMELRSMITVLESRIGELEKEMEKDELVNNRPTSCITVNSHKSMCSSSSSIHKESEKDKTEYIEDEDRALLRSARKLLSSRYSKYLHTGRRRGGGNHGDGNGDELEEQEEEEHALQMIYSQRSLAAVLKSLRQSFQTANVISSSEATTAT